MESIDALAKAVNEFEGGLVLVSHDMRLIGQVAKEIWICDNKTVTTYKGDIQNFKMAMRAQMGIEGQQQSTLRGDASEVKKEKDKKPPKPAKKAPQPKLEVVVPTKPAAPVKVDNTFDTQQLQESMPAPSETPAAPAAAPAAPANGAPKRYIPPHLRKKTPQ